MCADDRCHENALGLVTGYLTAVDGGEPPLQALCAVVAEALHATTSVHVHLEVGADGSRVRCWAPGSDDRSSPGLVHDLFLAFPCLLERILRDPTPFSAPVEAGPTRWQQWRSAGGGQDTLDGGEVAVVPLHVSTGHVRVVVLLRARRLTERELHVLRSAQEALSVLDRMLWPQQAPAGPAPSCPPSTEAGLVGDTGLTHRESQVLSMLAEGLLARTIALRLRVSTRTVHKHLENIYRKLGAHDRLLAVERARALGLLSAPDLSGSRGRSSGGTARLPETG